MIAYVRKSPSAVSFTTSLAVHIVFVAAALIVLPKAQSTLPLGVNRKGDATYIELGSTTIVRKPVVKVVEDKDPNAILVKRKKEKPKKVEEQTKVADAAKSATTPTQFGSATGTAESGPLGVANGIEVSERERYIYELRRLIDGRKIYPSLARRMRQTGKVVMKFEILKDGQIQNVKVAEPSAHDRLNVAAAELIGGIHAFKPLPDSTKSERMTVTVPVDYALF